MATANILLLQKVENLGYEGETVSVRAGYARNFLLPRKLAIPVTYANKKQVEALLKRRVEREQKELELARELAQNLSNLVISIAVKTGENGKLFGTVTSAHLSDKLSEHGFKVERKKIHLETIKTIGKHVAKIKLHNDVVVDFAFEVVSEN